MALSDYLNDEEWDACFYIYCEGGRDLGSAMRHAIDAMLDTGYVFDGLDSSGGKMQQIPSRNPQKLVGLMFGDKDFDSLTSLENGRRFLQAHAPSLVSETDAEWAEQMAAARESKRPAVV